MSAAPAKLQILLVEDSIEEIYLVRALLEKGGPYQVTTAQDGDQAARLIQQRAFALVITDLNLPGKDGYVLIKEIKESKPTLPVIATTGYTATHYVDHAYRAGADHVVVKPIDRDELLAKVGELAGGKAKAPPPAPPPTPVVLAIGALPGDIESGCGGLLLTHRDKGDSILMLPLSADGSGAEAERKAAGTMGARVILTESSVSQKDNPSERQQLLERIVRELKPHTALIPSLADDDPARREAHRIARAALLGVPTVLAYETATSTPDFRPTRFVDIGPMLDRKLEVLTAFHHHRRPDLQPYFTQASARYWGRHIKFGEAEPFEVLRDQGKDIA